jgi:DNA adenine methylase
MRYPGGKGGAGVHQKIINLIPEHETYIEAFVGGGAIYRAKRPAPSSIVIDADARSIKEILPYLDLASIAVNDDAISWLSKRHWLGDEFVYCDPPYLHSTRSKKRIYRHEMTDQQHIELASLLMTIPAAVMLSGYKNAIYDEILRSWQRVDFKTMTRGGVRTESLWLNYDPPAVPAELTYIGDNYRERERIKRKKQRWMEKLANLPRAEQMAIFEALKTMIDRG